MAEFKESEHPRDKDGKFTDKNSTSKSQQFEHNKSIGIYVNKQKGRRYDTSHGRIHYSNKGTHVVPDGKDRK